MNVKSKHERSTVVTVIVDAVRESSPQRYGGFVRKDLVTGRWYEVGDKIAREKVGHALREAIKLRNKELKKQNYSEPEERKPIKRQRTEVSTTSIQSANNAINKKEEAKPEAGTPPCSEAPATHGKPSFEELAKQKDLSTSEAILAPSAKKFEKLQNKKPTPLVSEKKSQDEWEKSLQESADLFNKALHTSAGDDNTEKAYHASIREMQLIEWMSPGDYKTEEELEAILNSLAPAPIDNSLSKPDLAASIPKLEWKPPGDSKTEDAFNAFSRLVKG